jgi:alkylation response protein AidB-like acyl-CoA dehydrogenase
MTYPKITAGLTEAQSAIAQHAHEFADGYLEPIVIDLDRGLLFPKALVGQLAADKFLGLVLPEQSGVAGAGFVSHIELIQALSQSSAGVASIVNSHALFAYAIAHWGSAAQKTRYLSALANGEKLGAVAITESGPRLGLGPDALFAARVAGGYQLEGVKTFVRNAGAADVYLVFATIQSADDGNGLTGFIVESGAKGLTVGPRLETMGLRACPVAHLTFSKVFVAEADVMGAANCGSVIANQLLSVDSVAEAAQTVGIARAAVKHAADYAKHRVQFRHPIARLQAVQTLLAEIATDSHMAWLGVQHAARLVEEDAPFEPEAAMVKAFTGRFGSKMLVNAVQIEGGMGISEVTPKHVSGSYPLARMFRDMAGTTLLDAPADFPDAMIAASVA